MCFPQTIALAPYMSRIYHQLPPKKTRGPDVAVSVSRLIFMRCHDNVQSDTPQSSPESHTDTTIRAGNRIFKKCHITPSSTTCFKPSDHLMYNLNNLNRGASTAEHPPPPPPETNRQPGTRPHTRNPKKFFEPIHLLHIQRHYYEKEKNHQ